MDRSETQIECDQLVGILALGQGMISEGQLDQAMKQQAQMHASGESVLLTDLMVEYGMLTRVEVEQLSGEGSQIGGYRLTTKLGRGGMGSVYKAVRIKDGLPAAVKLLARKRARDKKFVRRFLEEARMLAKVTHPHVIKLLEFDNDRGFYFFAMEFVDGITLVDRIEDEQILPEDDVLRIGRAVCLGLHAAWKQKVIHRDIKPENILLGTEGEIKLSDFGLAKDRQGGLKTTAGITFGTPHYMSPEQVQGSQDLDVRSDIYSLGATMYHALSGEFPFDGNTDLDIMVKHLEEEPVPIRDLNPEVSRPTVHLIERMMAHSRDDRHAEPADVAEEIDSIVRGTWKPQKMARVSRQLTTTKRDITRRIRRASRVLERPRTRWGIYLLALLSLLGFVGNLIYVLLTRK